MDFNSLSIYTFPNGVMAIDNFVPLVQLMTQVAETHTDKWKSLQTTLKYYTGKSHVKLRNPDGMEL